MKTKEELEKNKAWYEDQLNVYHETCDKMIELVNKTLTLYPIEHPINENDENLNIIYSSYLESKNQFLTYIEKNKPFYEENFYEEFIDINEKCYEVEKLFLIYKREIPVEELEFAYATSHIEIKKMYKNINKNIKEYIDKTYKI